ncbi:MAG: peptide chain release factor N(5)-glutamine methyltransferase [Pseudomonadota bacterium]
MTVADALRAGADRLSATSDTSRLDAEVLMAHALGVSRSDMLIHKMREGSPAAFETLVARRAGHEPVAYIVGEAEFYGRTFAVESGVLIPRGDSETIVEAALSACPAPKRLLDLGVGSGALLLTVMAGRPGCDGVGIDASPKAIDVARQNATSLQIIGNCDLRLLDWRESGWSEDLGTFDLILCNPPYVEAGAALEPDVRDFEPASALFAGPDGLDDYRLVIPQLRSLLTPSGVAVLEIGALQAASVTEMAREDGFEVELKHDLAGRPRGLVLS